MYTLWQDLRSVRDVVKQPGFTLVAVIHVGAGHRREHGDLSVVNAVLFGLCHSETQNAS